MSALPPIADMCGAKRDVRFVPCVDGPELARAFFTLAALGFESLRPHQHLEQMEPRRIGGVSLFGNDLGNNLQI
jgi:hypothetical protein